MIDFPEPVSPVTAVKPGASAHASSSTSARLRMRSEVSVAGTARRVGTRARHCQTQQHLRTAPPENIRLFAPHEADTPYVMQQQRYWSYFAQNYAHTRYLHYYREKSEEIERVIAVCSAITSSASIAGWAIWQKYGWFWAVIIAASQVLSATRSHLPYARRAEILRETASAFKALTLRIEGNWFRIQQGMLSEEEINDLITLFHKEQFDIEDKLFSKITLATRPDLLVLAETDTQQYFATYYGQQ